ncbi:MAG: RrF2 family transcriptional regulator [Thermoplasmata archaeon]|jgi:Rrf2 family protein|nr:RrF2 family transcriptional regulator [Thermoplasmata archaeon]WII08037.1 RrF2 family transcriptional regulator [Methanomassiliicoccales archaeon LGM-RCC1]
MSYLVSTKGRYALRVMLDMAEQGEGATVPLKDIAERQELSLKYLESIMPNLKESGLVTGVAGKGGGYKLSKPADQYTVGEILRVSEDQMAPVACLTGGFVCPKADTCKTLPMWKKLDDIMSDYLDTVKLTDLM